MEDIEQIVADNQLLSIIIRSTFKPSLTTFITPPEHMQQVGFVVYPEGGEILPHSHKPLRREVIGSSEVIVVQNGACKVDLYKGEKIITTRSLAQGDIIIFVSGGHGFRFDDDTVLLEIKQGPYFGVEEKEIIDDPRQ
jgi:hypothetical protein